MLFDNLIFSICSTFVEILSLCVIMAKNRINYIDALRGFTMIMVVFAHVLTFGFKMNDSFISQLFVTFRMPMFFFISGYIAYKGVERWDGAFYKKMLKKKAIVQIIPATVFWLLFVLWLSNDQMSPWDYIAQRGFIGYWFTYTLLVFFVIYYTISLIANKMPLSVGGRFMDIALVLIALLGIATYIVLTAAVRTLYLYTFSILNACIYFQFFVFGILSRKYLEGFEKMLNKDWVIAGAMVVFVACLFILFHPIIAARTPGILSKLCQREIVRYAGLIIVFAFFFKHASFFNRDNWFVKSLLFVGRRTLDIYLIHFFFMPYDNPIIGLESQMFVIQLLVATALSVVVVAISLAISRIIRMSSFLGHYLLGAKREEKN